MILRSFIILSLLWGSALVAQNNAAEQSSVTEESELCNRLFQKTVMAYQELNHKLPAAAAIPPSAPITRLLGMHMEDCSLPGTMDLIEKALSFHSGKIALLLPFSKLPKSVGQDLLKSIHTWMQSRGLNPARLIIWRDTDGNRDKLEIQLAQMVWLHQVSLIIGGLMQSEAPTLAQWSDRLRIPTIILNRKPESQRSKYAFYMGPDYKLLASSLTRYALSHNLQKIAILEPQYAVADNLVPAFQAQAGHLRLQITGPLLYNPADFSTIDGLLRKLFHIDDENRNEEMLELLKKRREEAEELGQTFDPKSLVLPPIVDVDAILIADHFKNVRHISKALAYYGVKKVQLLGIPKWRAYELMDPPDEAITGAVFVDYIGSYKQFPYGIQVPTVDKEYFAEGPQAGSADLRLVVHHALYSALEALAGARTPRFALYKKLETAAGPKEGFLASPQIYRADHTSNWPSFLFAVGSGSISLLQTWNPVNSPTRTSLSKP